MLEHVGWLKSFSGFWKAIFDRLALWVGRRKPKLYVNFEPGLSVWYLAHSGDAEYMQVVCRANITHDDPKIALIITDAHPVRTTTQVRAMTEFAIPPHSIVKEQIVSIASPVVGEKGKPWTGRIVLVDQFLGKYKTNKVTFKWVGS